MSDPAILFVKPYAISADDKRTLAEAGVIVVELEDPSSVQFLRPKALGAEMGGAPLLKAAALAIARSGSDHAKKLFAENVAAYITRDEPA